MRVAAIQFNASDDKSANVSRALKMVEQAIQRKATLICLPEVFNFKGAIKGPRHLAEIVEDVPGPSTQPLMNLAKKSKISILAGSIYEKSSGHKAYNTSVLIGPDGKIKATYRKINLFCARIGTTDVREAKYFLPGNKSVVAKANDFQLGLTVCYDLRFPQMYQRYAQQGAEIITVPSAFTYKTGEAHWEVLLRARAIENFVYVIAPNQIGVNGGGVKLYGHSMIIDPWGRILARASSDKEEIIYAEIRKDILKQSRTVFGRAK